jgi:hypothetical protein
MAEAALADVRGLDLTHHSPVHIAPRSWPSMGPMFSAFDAIRGFASRPNLRLPGHDPAVLQRFPTHSAGIAYLK